ncbi:MAG: hypothetical protein J6129_07130 [Bacteroidaceae bacterium]|nr:hypothetical protein [Bacteroidaceae bacterium]
MKKTLALLAVALMPMLLSAQTDKDRERFAYVCSQMELPKELKSKVQPIFYSYMKELHAAKDIYNDLKDKWLTPIHKKKITAEQAKTLNAARWRSDEEVLKVRRAYTQKFSAILTPQQVFYLFTYANDSKSKRNSKK